MATVVWLDNDLRLCDHGALRAASEEGPVVPVFVWAPEAIEDFEHGRAARWWLHQSLESLAERLEQRGSRLVVRRGPPSEELASVAEATGAGTVRWIRRRQPSRSRRDERVRSRLEEAGLGVEIHDERILHDPERIETTSGGPYHVFTPFWNRFQDEVDVPRPRGAPDRLSSPEHEPDSVELDELELLPQRDWDEGLEAAWTPGEPAARRRLETFVETKLDAYPDQRDVPGVDGTSRLSPRLAFGEVGPRQAWWAVRDRVLDAEVDPDAAEAFLRQLAWREFGYHLVHHYPDTTDRPLRDKYRDLEWREAPDELEAWRRGRTGYPIVDAGMRQLWATGWIHNRVRMVAAAFLAKHLLVPWQEGARWFWDTLVDADLANNTLGWQWAAGCGADAQPFFRMFNPVRQGERFDPEGAYVRRWVPELADLPDQNLHAPWEANPEVLRAADVELGEDYPEPIVDHETARERAQAAFDEVS